MMTGEAGLTGAHSTMDFGFSLFHPFPKQVKRASVKEDLPVFVSFRQKTHPDLFFRVLVGE